MIRAGVGLKPKDEAREWLYSIVLPPERGKRKPKTKPKATKKPPVKKAAAKKPKRKIRR